MMINYGMCQYLSILILIITLSNQYSVNGKGFDANGDKDDGKRKLIRKEKKYFKINVRENVRSN